MKNNTKQHVFVATVFAIVVAIICLLLPREKTINMEFAQDKPWRYEQLTAPFDFAITKSEAMLQRERAEALAMQRPYYTKEVKIGEAAIDSFNSFYGNELYQIANKMLKKKILTLKKKIRFIKKKLKN